jgi:nitrogen fixation/metabolism regulation signal transduction histidine kinase
MSLDSDLRHYRTEGMELPALSADWESLKKTEIDDEDFFQKYHDFANSLANMITWIGEQSGMILVSDMDSYYYIAPALSNITEASLRILNTGNLIRRNLKEAESVVERWNRELADSQAQGRRLNTQPFSRDARQITLNMFVSSDLQLIRNSRILFETDKERISASLMSAVETGINRKRTSKKQLEGLDELTNKLERYQQAINELSGQFSRISGFNIQNPSVAGEVLITLSQLNTDLCSLWEESFANLDYQIQRNNIISRWSLVVYLFIVFISLGLAVGFVIFITRDINRSVKSLKTLFKGLNENDLTLSLPINSEDEFGDLMTAFNIFLDILRSTFGSFKQSAQLVSSSVFDLSSSSKEITTTANEQSTSVSEIVSTMESSKR